ncbi:hypothetical protein EU546_08260, partial [Candidatus Thorarchaeota archaeon]
MRKKVNMILIALSLVCILVSLPLRVPDVPMKAEDSSSAVVDEPVAPEDINSHRQVEDNRMDSTQSKEIEGVRTEKGFHPCDIDPTAGDFVYTKTEISHDWIDATSGTWNNMSEDSSVALDLPFIFPFYGENFSTVYVSRHGWMSFYNMFPDSDWVAIGSSDEEFWYAVAPYAIAISSWQGTPGVYNLSLTSPNRFVIEYNNVYYEWGDLALIGTFQVILYENGTLDFNYDIVENESYYSYAVGLNHGAISGNSVYHEFSSFPVDNMTLRLTPPERWILITSSEGATSTDYTFTWIGHSNDTIDMYYVFDDDTFYDNTTEQFMDMTGLSLGWHDLEVRMETGGQNYTALLYLLVDNDPPTVAIDYPLDGTTLNDGKVNWTSTDPTSYVDYFDIYVNNSLYADNYKSHETYLVLENQAWYNITVIAYDALGNPGSDAIDFYYDRTVPAIGFVITHSEDDVWEVQELYRSMGYITSQIEDALTLDLLQMYDVIFVGASGGVWPSSDVTALEDYVNSGGKAVVMHSGSYREGLRDLMSTL